MQMIMGSTLHRYFNVKQLEHFFRRSNHELHTVRRREWKKDYLWKDSCTSWAKQSQHVWWYKFYVICNAAEFSDRDVGFLNEIRA